MREVDTLSQEPEEQSDWLRDFDPTDKHHYFFPVAYSTNNNNGARNCLLLKFVSAHG